MQPAMIESHPQIDGTSQVALYPAESDNLDGWTHAFDRGAAAAA